ncbi:hypothetical protein FZC76_16200 [Sutcliffiella horikoshii]|uniref:Uncharacterized protein n=1 Tax=Sutcliffiella horikoshii TaxID=79883 RepID=A0A5D4SZ23_9BACI|nr:hypothetical protein [Sutcliffiella horikoshii]TYS67066.1 hypothetical protein FZC76_16200 [Sutcliffiella horikoshii]
MRIKIEVGDTIRNPENGLVGILKKVEGSENYYVEGHHEYAGKWQTAGGSLRDYQKWDLMKKGDKESVN